MNKGRPISQQSEIDYYCTSTMDPSFPPNFSRRFTCWQQIDQRYATNPTREMQIKRTAGNRSSDSETARLLKDLGSCLLQVDEAQRSTSCPFWHGENVVRPTFASSAGRSTLGELWNRRAGRLLNWEAVRNDAEGVRWNMMFRAEVISRRDVYECARGCRV